MSKVLPFLCQNVLELALYDKDMVTQDDHLFTVYFDIARLSLGEQVFMHFKCDSQVRSEIRNIIGWQECVCLLFCLKCYLQNLSFFLLVYGWPSHIKGR